GVAGRRVAGLRVAGLRVAGLRVAGRLGATRGLTGRGRPVAGPLTRRGTWAPPAGTGRGVAFRWRVRGVAEPRPADVAAGGVTARSARACGRPADEPIWTSGWPPPPPESRPRRAG